LQVRLSYRFKGSPAKRFFGKKRKRFIARVNERVRGRDQEALLGALPQPVLNKAVGLKTMRPKKHDLKSRPRKSYP